MLTRWYIWNELDTIFAVWIVLCGILVAKNLSLSTGFLAVAGKATTNMWFLHAIFFGVYAEYTQKIAYLPRISVLIIVWVTVLLFVVAVVYDKIFDRLKGDAV